MSQAIGPRQEAWLTALESGTYKQARSALFDGTGYCCLGIACKVFGLNAEQRLSASKYYFNNEAAWLPRVVQHHFGFHTNDGETAPISSSGDMDRALYWLNDNGMSFAQIATKVRENPGHYFTEPK